MKNNYLINKQNKGWVVLMMLFCGLFANTAMGQSASANQDTFIWNGATSAAWEVPTNWTILRATSTPGTDTYPGQTAGDAIGDIVFVNKNDTPNALILASQTRTVFRLTISNQFGTESGSIMTINNGATLTVSSNGSNNLVLAGGNLVNNGALIITTTGVGFASFPAFGINCSNPSVLPTIAREYTYSGSGSLSITLSAANFANAAAFATSGNSANALLANTTYKLVLNNPSITLNQSTALAIGAIRTIPATGANVYSPKLIISGTGLTLGTVGTPSIGSLIGVGNATNLTVDPGTVLTLNSATANLNSGIEMSNSIAGTGDAETGTNRTRFTNNGTINIRGNTSANGIRVATFSAAGNPIVGLTFVNNGVIDVNINATLAPTSNSTPAAFQIPNGFGTTNTNALLTLTNNGTINLKNTSTAAGNGFAIWVTGAGERTKTTFVNNSILNIDGTTNTVGQSITFTNNATVNSTSSFNSFAAISNSSTGSITFSKAVNIPAAFIVDLAAAATAGSIYTDANSNSFTVGTTKVTGTGTSLGTSFNQLNTVPPSGTLTFVSGTGDATIAYTAVTVTTNAMTSPTTNSGIINTGKGALRSLSTISGVTDASIGTIAPGGTEYGIAELNKVSATPDGILKIQVAGNSAAGVDYDQLTNSFTGNTLTLSSLDLNIAFLQTPVSSLSVPIVNVSGLGSSIVGNFANVTGLKAGWALDYSSSTVVNLVYTSGTTTATTWTGTNSSVWTDAGNWSAGVPSVSSDVTIAAAANQPVIGSNVYIYSLTIAATASLVVNAGFLAVTDAITNNGTLTVASNADLIQVNNVTNTTNITVNRNSNALSRFDYTIWSSPVASQDLLLFSPATLTNRFYNYNQVTNQYNVVPFPSGTSFAAGSGYLIRMPDTAVAAPATQTFAAAFTGIPNNGTVTVPMTYNGAAFGYNMVGNPYPSTIDAQELIAANTANIESSLYFWRKVNGATGSAYAVYNPLGATTATPSSALPNGTIQVGQGFFVKAKSASNLTFTNAMRVNNGNQFFKTRATQKDRVWLNLTNASGVFSQALVGYTADATLGLDIFDGKYINDSEVALTSSINNEDYTIQGRPAFDASDVVALNFKTDLAGDYTIALDHFDGVFATGQDVYLLDSKTGAETDLKAGSYTFTADAGVDNARFSLKYQKTLKVDALAFNENSVSVYKNNGTLYVNSSSAAISTIEVYDIQGRVLASQRNVKANTATISNLRAINQVLIVKVSSDDNSVVRKKVMN